jgi:cobalamin synthase
MSKNATTSATPVTGRPPRWWLGFIGLAPIALTLPLAFLQLWSLYVVAVIATSLLVLGYRLLQRQRLNGANVLNLLFGVFNAVLYFGLHTSIVLQYVNIAIYTLLFVQVVFSLLWGESWSEQFTKPFGAARGLLQTRTFHEGNRFVTIIWAAVFLLCALIEAFAEIAGKQLQRLELLRFLPLLLLVVLALQTGRLLRWYITRSSLREARGAQGTALEK